MLIPDPSLVVLVGPSGSGKSTFARRHFKPTEILSSDAFRAMVSDDETDQTATAAAFELLHHAAAKRLQHGRLTVIDATNVKTDARRQCLDVARRYHLPAVAVVFQLDEATCLEQNLSRPDRQVPAEAIKRHLASLDHLIKQIHHEGFRDIHVFHTAAEAHAAVIERQRAYSWKRHEAGPFDVIGDVHGCLPELLELLAKLGYGLQRVPESDGGTVWDLTPPDGRRVVFVGDLVDRGPDTPGVLRLVRRAMADGKAFCVRGNHDDKLHRKLAGRDVNISSGLAESLDQISREPAGFADEMRAFLETLPLHLVFDGGRFVVAHAGLKCDLHGRDSDRVRAFCLFGDTTGEYDQYGLPVRLNWAADYHGPAHVVYGHVPTYQPQWLNKTLCIDTGCVFGGWLTAVRYPEMETVSVRAHGKFAESKRPFIPLEKALSAAVSTAAGNLPGVEGFH